MQSQSFNLTLLLLLCSFLIVLMGSFILVILFIHRKKQIAYLGKLNSIQADYEKNLFKAQLEIQEQTFEHISKEIHDNINLSLSLVKLNLNTLQLEEGEKSQQKIESSISLLTKSINELSNLSKGLNADNIIELGLVKTLENEIDRIHSAQSIKVEFKVTGNPIYLNAQRELIIFRIIQEAFNNIIKHSCASKSLLHLHYDYIDLQGKIEDNGKGFDYYSLPNKEQAGLKNMKTRARLLGGILELNTSIGNGTKVIFKIPFKTDGDQ